MTIYIDITQLYNGRANTGIQRVLKEFLQRALNNQVDIVYKVITYNTRLKTMELLNNEEVLKFLNDIQHFNFSKKDIINIENIKVLDEITILYDIDSVWNTTISRDILYPILKKNGFLIFNFIHDVMPLVIPSTVHINTVKFFKPFIEAVYKYSDMVLFNSFSSQNDFFQFKEDYKITRNISSRVTGLGSDFFNTNTEINNAFFNKILQKKYILFVGTIEPRKNQTQMLEAFEVLADKYKELSLVFIGKEGWYVNKFIKKINEHRLKDTQLYWLDNVDDNSLNNFYNNAYIVTYLSKYEGYGLPIAESLQYGNITITSKNSSMYEVGRNYADYVEYGSRNELVDIISLYLDNPKLYNLKKEYIKKNFKTTSWEDIYDSTFDIFNNFDKSLMFKKNHLDTLQFVFISIDLHNLKGTIQAIDKYISFVKEYIIVTQPKLVKEFESITSKHNIKVIDERIILKDHAKDFSLRDHQSKNWLLRASLLNLDCLDDEFIMLDDDNRPLKDINIDKFISSDGSYNSYYFYNLLEWNHTATDYDKGQQNTESLLREYNYELLSYSSHSPQIINKKIFAEVVDKFFDIGLNLAIDEWSTYFNYASSNYPYLFNKKVYETLNWPATPFQWAYKYFPNELTFENYYVEQYQNGVFDKMTTNEEKVKIKEKQILPFIKTIDVFKENIKTLSTKNMIHGICSFKTKDVELYISNIPYLVELKKNSDYRLRLNYKLLQNFDKNLDIEILVLFNGVVATSRKLRNLTLLEYQESIIEIPLISSGLDENIYDITFDVKINGKKVYNDNSPYLIKLIVVEDRDFKIINNFE